MSWLSKAGDSIAQVTGLNIVNPKKTFDDLTGVSSAREANQMSLASSREQMGFQERMAKEQRDYEAKMSGSAHQREVADLKAAGINPVLTSGGSGASTPSVSVPTGSSYTAQNVMPGGYLGQMLKVMEIVGAFTGILKESASADQIKTETELLKQKVPRGEVSKSLWEIIVPWSRQIRQGFSNPRDAEKDINAIWSMLGLGLPEKGPKIKNWEKSNNLKLMNGGK